MAKTVDPPFILFTRHGLRQLWQSHHGAFGTIGAGHVFGVFLLVKKQGVSRKRNLKTNKKQGD
ncbi:MAG: hypothetical protein EOP33_06185 [Rickettsiaceae bacterium]|nr:MAG: hypothetical protein EOP33_06185 [Rickettsiaceae bacterium]